MNNDRENVQLDIYAAHTPLNFLNQTRHIFLMVNDDINLSKNIASSTRMPYMMSFQQCLQAISMLMPCFFMLPLK